MRRHIDYCNSQDLDNPKIDPRQAKWSSDLSNRLAKLHSKSKFEKSVIRMALYRPFFRQYLYFERTFVDRPGKTPLFFPKASSKNLIIIAADKDSRFSLLITNVMPDLHTIAQNQCFPLHTYDKSDRQHDNITDYALKEYQTHYQDGKITKTDIFHYVYGLLHHPGYRKKYANSLLKGLPHIPMAPDFWAFKDAGQYLADVHLGYFDESRQNNRYPLGPPKNSFDSPTKLAFAKSKDPETTRQVTDYTRLKINGVLAYDNIPETYYRVGGRTPLEWLVSKYRITTDNESGIINNPCEKITGKEMISMVEQAVYVGVKSDEIINGLPEEFEPAKWKPQKTGLDRYINTSGPAQSSL